MTTSEIRQKFLKFFEKRGHAILNSVSVVTTDEKTTTDATLFNTAGVQPLVPYLLGEKHPEGKKLASSQKCIRTIDIDEVGDKTHLTFFEMLGNWSLGDYFKEDSIKWSYEFITSKEEGLGLDPNRLYITVFGGNDVAEKDEEAFEIWKKYIPENRIYFLESNWWEAGDNGPCGPDTEFFYDLTESGLGDLTHDEYLRADEEQDVVEIWNNVFMQFEKKDGKVVGKLPAPSVDTGAGLERMAVVVNKKDSVYETDNFAQILEEIENQSKNFDVVSARIVADHVKASSIIIADGIIPSNTDRGYIVRRLIRRAIRHADKLGLPENYIQKLTEIFEAQYSDIYPNINSAEISKVLADEELKFRKTLKTGLREFEKMIATNNSISGKDAFLLFSTYGFPIELVMEIAKEKNISVDKKEFETEMDAHKNLSKTSSAGKFKGGLESAGEMEIKYHTATHLLHAALRQVLGEHVEQKGSNINEDRLRFDFSHEEKMSDEQKIEVEEIVNQKISEGIPVNQIKLPKEEALKTGALHLFADKYEDTVSVYYIGEKIEDAFSKEFCGGPHVKNTSELGQFKIKKEEASSAGVRRIKATLS